MVELCTYKAARGDAKPVQVAVKKLKPAIVEHEEDLKSFLAEVWGAGGHDVIVACRPRGHETPLLWH